MNTSMINIKFEELKQIVKILPQHQKDEIFELLWLERIEKDIRYYLSERYDDYDEKTIKEMSKVISEKYVLNLEHDDTLTKEENICNLLHKYFN